METDGNSALSFWFPCRRVAHRANDKLLSEGGYRRGVGIAPTLTPGQTRFPTVHCDPTFCKLKSGQCEQGRPGQACHCDGLPFWTTAQCYDALDKAPRGQGSVVEGKAKATCERMGHALGFSTVRHSTQRSNQMSAWGFLRFRIYTMTMFQVYTSELNHSPC